MDTRKNRTSIASLRTSDPKRLEVLVPEVLSQPVGQIEPSTLVDIIALSELIEQLPAGFIRDLQKFRKRIFDQVLDLPETPDLARFVSELADLEADAIPQTLREFLATELLTATSNPDALSKINELAAQLQDAPAQDITLPDPAPVSSSSKATKKSGKSASSSTAAAKKPRKTRISAAQVDERRAEWIEEDVLDRLSNYGNRGLKQSIIVAGSRHRASWKDLSEAEVLAVLRRLKRESKVRYSAGRWMIQT